MPKDKKITIKKDVPDLDKINDSTYKLNYNDNAEVEIGNISEEDFHPHAKIKRWKDGSSFSLELSKNKVTSFKEEEGKIKCKIGTKKEIHYYPLEKNLQMEEGGLEVEVLLKEKPTTNVVEFDIDSENFAFYKQLPYNKQTESPEDKAAGVVKRTGTQGLDKDGKVIAEMPENAVNSYAVYHKTKVDGVYKAGKAFHIYRPKAVDAKNKEVWCDLDIDTDTNKLTVTIAQKFLDNATYPVKVDPTFGYTTLGSLYITLYDCIIGRNAEPDDEHGIVNSMHAGLDTSWGSGDKAKMALYNLKGSLISPQTVERDQGHDTCQFVHFPINATPAKCPIRKTDYVIAWWSNLSVPIRRDYGTSGDSRYCDTNYGDWPENVNWSLSSYKYSTYAMYEFEDYNDWLYSTEVVIDTTDSGAEVDKDVSNIPMLLRLDSNNFDFTQAKSDGTDIRFAKPDGTKLYYAIERWDSSNKIAELWVYLDKVYGYNTTTIKMFWGNSDAPDTSMPKAVFNTDDCFEGTWHLDEGSGNTAHDETYNEYDGNYNGNLPTQVDGMIYKAQDFDGNGDYIGLPAACFVSNSWTLEFWIKPNSPDNYERIFIQGSDGCASKQIVAYWLNGHIEFGWTNTGTCTPDIASGAIPNGQWSHVVWTFNGTTHKVYVNGVSSSTSPTGSNIGVDGGNYIGCRGGTQNFFTGCLDEMRILSATKSAYWVKLSYYIQKTDQTGIIIFKGAQQECLWTQVPPTHPEPDSIYRENGNVAIGNNDPLTKLHIFGSNPILSIHHDDDMKRVELGSKDGQGGVIDLFDINNNIKVSLKGIGDSYISGGNVGIGTLSPGAKLEVGGGMIISDGSGNESIIVAPPPQTNSGDRQRIQDAIDALPTNGGTVILQRGTYQINKVVDASIGLLVPDGVHLYGSSMFGSVLKPGDNDMDVIYLYPHGASDFTLVVMKNFRISNPDEKENIIGINIGSWETDYNHGPQPVLVESVFVEGCRYGNDDGSTDSSRNIGIMVSSYFSELFNCKIRDCNMGIKLRFIYLGSSTQTNCAVVNHCQIWGYCNGAKMKTGVQVEGVNNQIVGCNIGEIWGDSSEDYGYGIRIVGSGDRANYIARNYIESGSGPNFDHARGIYVNSKGNTIIGNYFDLRDTGLDHIIDFNSSSIEEGNFIISNMESDTVLDSFVGSKLGVGTTSPSEKLDVYGDILSSEAGQGFKSLGSSSSNFARFFMHGTSDYLAVRSYKATGDRAEIRFQQSDDGTNIDERMIIDSGGNVGVGCTNPGYPLDVVGMSRIRGADSSGGGLWLTKVNNPTSDYSYMGRGTDGDAFLGFYNNGSWRLVVKDSNGNIGIGVTNPVQKLEVNGNIKGDGLDVSSTSAPSSPTDGMLWFDTDDGNGKLKIYDADNTTWRTVYSMP